MKRFIGTKILKAQPMTLGEYNAYREWVPPPAEDQATPGYLVEYEDGGKPNDARHAGYISWSPAAVFEGAYAELPPELQEPGLFQPYQERVIMEAFELGGRLGKLTEFLGGQMGKSVAEKDPEEYGRLKHQKALMQVLHGVLQSRIAHFIPTTA